MQVKAPSLIVLNLFTQVCEDNNLLIIPTLQNAMGTTREMWVCVHEIPCRVPCHCPLPNFVFPVIWGFTTGLRSWAQYTSMAFLLEGCFSLRFRGKIPRRPTVQWSLILCDSVMPREGVVLPAVASAAGNLFRVYSASPLHI